MKKLIFYASAPGLEVKHQYSSNEARQHEVHTALECRYYAGEQCWYVMVYHHLYLGESCFCCLFQETNCCVQLFHTRLPPAGQKQFCMTVLCLPVAPNCCLPVVMQSLYNDR